MTAQVITPDNWKLEGNGRMTDAQRRLLNAACGDLAVCLNWHGNRLSKDDWRHFLSGNAMGWRMMPGIDMGTGAPGFIMLGGSSLDMTRTQATTAIQAAFYIGDRPDEQGLKSAPVRWCDVVCLARGISDSERWAA